MLKVVRPVPVCKIPTSLDECEIILSQLFRSTNSITFLFDSKKPRRYLADQTLFVESVGPTLLGPTISTKSGWSAKY